MPTIDDSLAAGTGFFTVLVKMTGQAQFGSPEIRVALTDTPVTFESAVYDPAPFVPTTIQKKGEVETDNSTVMYALNSLVTRANLVGGMWAGARIEIILMDYKNPSYGAAVRRVGRLGQSNIKGLQNDAEFRGLMDLLNQPVGDRTSLLCRLKLGETHCGVNLASFTRTGTVVSTTNRQRFLISFTSGSPSTADDSYYKNGLITFTSGPNNGLQMETIDNSGNTIILFEPMLNAIAAGHTFNLIAGDDKSLQTCFSKFNNAVNFGGEPDMPTTDQVFTVPV